MKRLLARRVLLLVSLSLLATLLLSASAYAGQIDPVLSSYSFKVKGK
jgi:hypothetical protein